MKNLFDIEGMPTLAGSKINSERAPASRDASLVRRLRAAGAVLVGALNMDEYAYGFTTENTHYGVTRNPYDLARTVGGSSGGSAAAAHLHLARTVSRRAERRMTELAEHDAINPVAIEYINRLQAK